MKACMKILFPIAIITILFTSCHKKGCTNKDAINFDVTSDEDDGTCIVCQTTEVKLDSKTLYLKDENFGSPHYNQKVAKFYLDQYVQTPNNKVCGKETSSITLKIESLVSQNMYVYYRVQELSGPINIYYYNDITINAYQTIEVGTIQTFNNPPFFKLSLDSITATTQSDIIYF